MLTADEKSVSFQEEVLRFLFLKLLENLYKDVKLRNQKQKEFWEFLQKNDVHSIEDVLQKIDVFSKWFRIPSKSLASYFQKNYFKAVQNLKKQKELWDFYLSDENTGLIEILSGKVFIKDLSSGKFTRENGYYFLKLPDQTFEEIGYSPVSKSDDEQPKKSLNRSPPKIKETPIIMEIIERFSRIDCSSKNLVQQLIEQNIQSQIENSRPQISKKEKSSSTTIIEEKSIIEEIVQNFENIWKSHASIIKEISEHLTLNQKERISSESTLEVQSESLDQTREESFVKIPFGMVDYIKLRNTIQSYRSKNQMEMYRKFVANSEPPVKACIGLLNILNQEAKNKQFSVDSAIQQLSNKVEFSYLSLKEFYQRIKKYNLIINFVKQASQYLQSQNPELAQHFLSIREPLLDFLSMVEGKKEEYVHDQYLEQNLKLLLISIPDSGEKNQLKKFLKQFFLKIKPYL